MTALTLVGRFVGGALGGPVGALIGGMAGGLIGSFLFNRSHRPLIPDVSMMGSSFGNPLPIIYGTVRLPGTVLWMSEVTTKGHGLGKGLGGSTATSYWQNASVGFCEGPASLVKIYLDGKLFLDNTTTSLELTKYRFALRQFSGGEDQLPDFLYTAWVNRHILPANAAPAYRGVAHMVFDKIDLAHFGNRFPQVSAVWSTDVVQTTIFRQLIPWTNDVSTDHSVLGEFLTSNGACVDWARKLAYQLSNDGTIRVYDLSTQQCIAAKTRQQLATFYPNLDPVIPPAGSVTVVGLAGICCGSGSKLYLYGSTTSIGSKAFVWTIDPNTLTIIQETPFPDWQFASAFEQVICFTIATPDGSTDLLFGHTVFTAPHGAVFVFDPLTGIAGFMHTSAEGIFAQTRLVVGNQDPITGFTDLWLVSASLLFDPLGHIWIEKAVLTGSDPSQLTTDGSPTLIQTLMPADFGFGSGSVSVGWPQYDASDDSLIFSGTLWSGASGAISFKWSETAGIVWVNAAWTGPQTPMVNTYLNQGMTAGDIGWVQHYVSVVETATGTRLQSPISNADYLVRGPALVGNMSYDGYSNALVYADQSGGLYVAYLQRVFGNEVPVAAIIQNICARAGLDVATEVDVTLVTQTTYGYAILAQKSAGQAIADLCDTYQIDMVESDYQLKFIPRGQASIATITQAELGSIDPQDNAKYWMPKRAQELEMPLQITVKYPDPNLDFQPGSAYAKRTALPVPTAFSKRKKTIDLPVVATSVEAQQIAEKWLYTMWAERTTYETLLAAKYLWLDPTDNVTVTLDNGDSYTTRIETVELGADYALKLALASEDATTYSGSTSQGPVYGQTPQVIVPAPLGSILLFNTPLLQDSDDLGGISSRIYFAAGAYGTGWIGGGMYNSLDGANWTLIETLAQAVDWGTAASALGNTPAAFATDYTNTVRITFSPGSAVPVSCSYTDLMNGVNAAILGSEIIQFQTVTDNGDGTHQLSVLARGRRGTDWATGTHQQGENLVMLESGKLGSERMPLAQISQLEGWRLVPLNRFIDDVPSNAFTYRGYDLKPYAPISFKRTVSGSDLALTWVRRTRLGGLLVDGSDTAPLSEASEAYQVYLLAAAGDLAAFDPTDPATYVRAFTGLSAATVTYTAAMMVSDSFTPATDTLYMIVFQVSAVIGRGFQGYQALPPF